MNAATASAAYQVRKPDSNLGIISGVVVGVVAAGVSTFAGAAAGSAITALSEGVIAPMVGADLAEMAQAQG